MPTNHGNQLPVSQDLQEPDFQRARWHRTF